MSLQSQSFAHLFRHSKLASVTYTADSLAGQVLRASEDQRATGDWGLKHSLPPSRMSVVTVSHLDHPLTHSSTPVSAVSKLAALDRFKRIFGAFVSIEKRDPVADAATKTHLAKISDQEFAALVQKAKQLQPAEKGDWEAALGVSSAKSDDVDKELGIHPPFYWSPPSIAAGSAPQEPISLSPSAAESSLPKDAAPQDPRTVPVVGRYLNAVLNGHAVGISGYVAFLHDSEVKASLRAYAVRPASESGRIIQSREFADAHERKPGCEIVVYIQNVSWDATAGRWQISVTQRNPLDQAILFDSSSMPSGGSYFPRGNMRGPWSNNSSSLMGPDGLRVKSATPSSMDILQTVRADVGPRKKLPDYLTRRAEGLVKTLEEMEESSDAAGKTAKKI
ncbi:hypothetical protein HDU80_001787 [Chytriomyces hyalinus]|nr:hypothetical protein HDU80_001787 [Chytriomyces hyalinus]